MNLNEQTTLNYLIDRVRYGSGKLNLFSRIRVKIFFFNGLISMANFLQNSLSDFLKQGLKLLTAVIETYQVTSWLKLFKQIFCNLMTFQSVL